jgi:hypothetical protein
MLRKGASKILRDEYDYFTSSLDELLSKYSGRYIAIKNGTVIGDYDNFDDAYVNTSKTEKLGSFIIQHCVSDDEDSVAHFAWNNVSFKQVGV